MWKKGSFARESLFSAEQTVCATFPFGLQVDFLQVLVLKMLKIGFLTIFLHNIVKSVIMLEMHRNVFF
jgi:hypothetical protein